MGSDSDDYRMFVDGDLDVFGYSVTNQPVLQKPSIPGQWVNLDSDIVSSAGKSPFGFGGSGNIPEYSVFDGDIIQWQSSNLISILSDLVIYYEYRFLLKVATLISIGILSILRIVHTCL